LACGLLAILWLVVVGRHRAWWWLRGVCWATCSASSART